MKIGTQNHHQKAEAPTCSSRNILCDGVPVVRAEPSHHVHELLVLLRPPVSSAHTHVALTVQKQPIDLIIN